MAHFYGSVRGQRGEVSRLGGPNTGLKTVAKGWDFGVEVQLVYDEKSKTDYAKVYQTKGSNDPHAVVQEFELRPERDGILKPNVNQLLMFCHEFLREFEDAADVNETNAKLVATAKRLVGVVDEQPKKKTKAKAK
jgi:hypothetical protein